MNNDIKNNVADIGCTIIILTYNRPDYLMRILSYYNEYGGYYNVIVADSSSTDNKEINKKFISSISSTNTSYISYPQEINPFHKVADALKYVNMKYCVICADDDFITPNGINQSVDFLESNPDFAIAHGRYISFWLERRGNGQYFRWQPIYSALSITFEHPAQRLTYHLSNYSPTFYAVHRTALLRLIFAETLKAKLDTLRFSELLGSMLAVVYGKMKHLDVLYAAREDIPDSAGRTSRRLPDFMREGTYDEKYAKFRDCLSTHLSEQSQLNVKESKTLIDDAMAAYMKKCYGYNYKAEYVLRHVPRPIDKGIRALYRKLFLPKQNTNLPISHTNNDLNKIRLCVLSYGNIDEMIDASAKRSKGAI